MDNFTVLSSPLFEEIESLNSEFLVQDFERTWGDLDLSDLTDEEKSLQADFNLTMNTVEDKSPWLDSAAADLINDAPMFTVNTINSEIDGLTFNIMEPFGDETMVLDPSMIMATDKKEDEVSANVVEDIKYIHSYSLPLENKPEEIDMKPKVAEIKPEIRKVQAGRVTKRKRKPVKKFDDSSDDDSDAEFEGHKQVKSGSRKVKLYQMPEFKNDPAMEQKRQNAINAKVNRDRKKKEKNALQSQMQVLRNENKSLNKKNKKYRSRLSSLEKRLEIMEAVISSHGLNSALKASGKKGFSPSSSSSSSEDEDAVYYGSSE